MLSFWEKTELLEYDLVVVGGGITGMFCALSFRKSNPNARIAVLERGMFSSGASTKNAGFACFGSLTEFIEDLEHLNESALFDIVKLRLEGLKLLEETLGTKVIDLQWNGGYELFFEQHPTAFEKIEAINTLLNPIFNKPVFTFQNSKIKTFGLNPDKVKHLIENPFEGQLNTGKLMQALRSKINREKIDFFSNSELVHFESSQDQKIYFSFKNQTINLISKKLAICNNAFATQLYPDIDITPGRGMVVATKPIENLKLKGTFHYDQGYYYFRNFNQRILFGGGRNLDLKKEATHEFGINEKIKAQLLEDLQSFILLDQEVEIDTEWSGIMAFGKNKMPIIEKRGDQIALGIRLGGMGVAIGSRVGKAVAELLIK